MEKKIFIIFVLLYSSLVFSQIKNTELKLTKDSDTLFWNGYKTEQIKKYDLNFVEDQQNKIVFRFWTYGNTIEISKTQDGYTGAVNYFVDEVAENSNRIFKKSFALNKETSEKIKKLIDSTQIQALPSDNQIKGWEKGYGGLIYLIEYKTETQYSLKNYWAPKAQQNVPETLQFQNFVDELKRISEDQKLIKQFTQEIPFRFYTYNEGSTVICKNSTLEEYQKYKIEELKKEKSESRQ